MNYGFDLNIVKSLPLRPLVIGVAVAAICVTALAAMAQGVPAEAEPVNVDLICAEAGDAFAGLDVPAEYAECPQYATTLPAPTTIPAPTVPATTVLPRIECGFRIDGTYKVCLDPDGYARPSAFYGMDGSYSCDGEPNCMWKDGNYRTDVPGLAPTLPYTAILCGQLTDDNEDDVRVGTTCDAYNGDDILCTRRDLTIGGIPGQEYVSARNTIVTITPEIWRACQVEHTPSTTVPRIPGVAGGGTGGTGSSVGVSSGSDDDSHWHPGVGCGLGGCGIDWTPW